MSTTTTYLFGDSTPSPLETDFIAFLRDVFDFGAQVLQCDGRISEAMGRVTTLSEETDREIEAAEAFAVDVSRALETADVGTHESIAARCAVRIRQGVEELVQSESEAARASVSTAKSRAAQTAAAERDACFKALERLLLHHTLPESLSKTRLRIEGGSRYEAHLSGLVPYGLEWTLSLAIPEGHALSSILRVERVVPRLEVEAPEEAGWIHKEVKIRPQRFDRLYVSEVALDSERTAIKLRAEPDGTGAGFDISLKHETGRMQLARVSDGGASPDAPYDVTGEDVAKLRSFHNALIAMVREIAGHKKSLVKSMLDETPMQQVDSPRELVDRLIANIAPTVHEIARRSLAPGELVLKRLLSDSRREEIFVSTAELQEKLRSLSATARKAFEPLGLSNHRPSARAPAPATAERTPEGAGRPPSARPSAQYSAPDSSVAPQPVVLMSPSGRTPSQPPEALPAQGSVRPSQPPPR
jgi:hypothetical protein